jgi:hypothetical protein
MNKKFDYHDLMRGITAFIMTLGQGAFVYLIAFGLINLILGIFIVNYEIIALTIGIFFVTYASAYIYYRSHLSAGIISVIVLIALIGFFAIILVGAGTYLGLISGDMYAILDIWGYGAFVGIMALGTLANYAIMGYCHGCAKKGGK